MKSDKTTRENNKNKHRIDRVVSGSIAEELEIEKGDLLLSVNGAEIEDVFDYRYQMNEEYVTLLIQKPDGEQWELEIEKDYDEDPGIVFENGLMDDYRSCSNHCIFCFIDQMPEGMLDTLYFKDDDSRLSFLQGNYVTLTNMKDRDIERIIMYRLAPINISVHTMDPQLRCRMLNNRFAGKALQRLRQLYEAGIEMNGQIVLCKGINDGENLEQSIRALTDYLPHMASLSVVPVGLTKYREGLKPLEPFTKEDARKGLRTIHKWQNFCKNKWDTHFVHASDEWYLLAEENLPEGERYDGYIQLENGVGMLRLLIDGFREALADDTGRRSCDRTAYDPQTAQASVQADGPSGAAEPDNPDNSDKTLDSKQETAGAAHRPARISVATGVLAAPFIRVLAEEFMSVYPERKIEVFTIRNDFFGEQITVAGLLTGQDILAQLKGRKLGERLLLPNSLLRSGEEVFLDDMTVTELKKALQVEIVIVNSNGQDLYHAFLQ